MRRLILGLSLLCSLHAQAKEHTMEDLLVLTLDELASIPVVTAARSEQHWDDVQGSLWVITEKEIRERGYRYLSDVMRDLPSVDLQGPYNTTSRLTVRGMTGNAKMLILQDGVRVGAPAGEVVPVSINYPLYMAKQVEVLLTAGSALYGTDAVAGVVNIISRAPRPQDAQQVMYESNDNRYRHGHLLVHGLVGTRPIVLGAHSELSNNLALAEQYPDVFQLRDLRDVSGQKVLISADYRRPFQSDADSSSVWGPMNLLSVLELGFSYRQARYANDYSTLADANEYGGFLGETFLSVYSRWQQSFNEHLATNTLLSWSSYQLDKNSYYNNVFSNYQAGYKYADSKKIALDSQWTYRFHDHHKLVSGLVFEHISAVPRSTDLSRPYDNSSTIAEQNLYYYG